MGVYEETDLCKKFHSLARRNWSTSNVWSDNYNEVPNKSGVYFIVLYDMMTTNRTLVYVGSSTNLYARYKSHNIIKKISTIENALFEFFFKEMEAGFYDYEIKLINKLKPLFNSQHKLRGLNG